MRQIFVGSKGRMHMLAMGLATSVVASASAQHQVASHPSVDTRVDAATAERLLARPVTVHLRDVSLATAIDAVAASAKVFVQYQLQRVDAYTKPLTVQLEGVPLRVALERILIGTALQAVPDGPNQLSVIPFQRSEVRTFASGTVTGRVIDAATKQPLVGATVLLDDAPHGVLTDAQGVFRVANVSAGEHRVVVRLLGRGRQAKTVIVNDGETTTMDFALDTRVPALEQVVVTGTVVQTELKAVPNAITVITAKQIEERGITRIDQLFRGDVPGLFATNAGSSTPLDEVAMFSRGATALTFYSAGVSGLINTSNAIKTYVDGVELSDAKYLWQIDPKSIERIEIITGPQASTIYGSNAINGVMQIFTKRGTTNTPQLTLNLLSGWVENNFRSTRTPQHDYSAQLSGLEGHLSYNAGGSWNYIGPWTPAKKTVQVGGFGGTRLELPTPLGRTTIDATFRRDVSTAWQRGVAAQLTTDFQESGWYSQDPFNPAGVNVPTTYTLTDQTLGLTVGYTPLSWWSHEVSVGQDASDTEWRYTAWGYLSVSDTALQFEMDHSDRRSLRYTSTAHIPVGAFVQTTIVAGADAWQRLSTSLFAADNKTLTGSLTGSTSVSRQPDHNAGGFVQTQVAIGDQLFLTYGLRAEWNPNFGADAQPNYAPRYGLAYTREFGLATVKLRTSYGRSTRPPMSGDKAAQTIFDTYAGSRYVQTFVIPYFGNFDRTLANPELGPEYQQGGEGGLELYLGTRGSLVITRYNQTIDALIDKPKVDSVRALTLTASSFNTRGVDGYGYWYQYQYLNIGSIRNQGWELQGSLNTGPFTTKGTYSWTKSRVIGITPKYHLLFDPRSYPQYQPGSPFQFLPEHTWAFGTTYAQGSTTVTFNVTGRGRISIQNGDLLMRNLTGSVRLTQNRFNVTSIGFSRNMSSGYALADLTASHRISPHLEGVLQIQNLANQYGSDFSAEYATMGRQGKLGGRVRF